MICMKTTFWLTICLFLTIHYRLYFLCVSLFSCKEVSKITIVLGFKCFIANLFVCLVLKTASTQFKMRLDVLPLFAA